ncbi:hypothetical protein L917_19224 [Phytophthora nicotianae]|uniref:Uncharacterized protein n=1 Tax=Phytophthora nicotianae TaxID=4792 RepID=W2K571_PHYNI|nr:hypothetical protein L917_19224 [Phytophthora nicotianae]
MSASCTSLPVYDVLHELIRNGTHSCNLVELQEAEANVTFRAASFLDDYIFRPSSLDRMNIYEFAMACFRRKQSKSAATTDLILPGHPLFNTHCIGHHQTEAVPVITGVRMPYVDSKTPSELVFKRAKCALALFKPFRAVLDLVGKPANEAAWIDAYVQWEPTRSSFVREVMANMDDYHHASQLAQQEDESGSNELEREADNDDTVGTRNDIDGTIANIQCDDEAPVNDGTIDDFCHVFTKDDDAAMDTDGGSLPIYPARGTDSLRSSIVHQELLDPTAECTARTAIDLANGDHELALSVAELQEWVKDLTNDEAELPPAGLTRDERSADVIELIQSALKSDGEWSPPNQQHDWPPPTPLRPYPSNSHVSTAFTLSRRQHTAFMLVARALLRRFQQQERANVHKLLTIALATSSPDYETTSCSCSLVVPVAPARVV